MYIIIFYNSQNPKDYIEIPQQSLPEELEMSVKINNEEQSILNIGDVVKPGIPALRKYTLECMFPQAGAPHPPIYYLNFLRKTVEERRILRLITMRTTLQGESIYNGDLLCVIDEYSVKEMYGAVGDQFVTIKFKEYRQHSTKVVTP